MLKKSKQRQDYPNEGFLNIITAGANIADAIIKPFSSIKKMVKEIQRNKINETNDVLGDMLVNRYLLIELKKLGLSKNWYKLMIDKRSDGVWIKNTSGIYVAINKTLFNKLGLKNYEEILGKNDTDVRCNVKDSKGVDFLNSCSILKTALSYLPMDGKVGLVSSDNENRIFKYVIRSKDGTPIALFGMLIEDGVTDKSTGDLIKMKIIFEEEIKTLIKNV